MRYVKIPAAVLLVHPESGEPMMVVEKGKDPKQWEYPWDAFVKGLFLHPSVSSLDILAVLDLKTRLLSAKNGETLMLDDAAQGGEPSPWQLACTLARKPAGIAPMFALQAAPYIRALVDAATEGTAAHADSAKAEAQTAKKARK